MIANSIVRTQMGGSATRVSKQMFIKVRKKNAVRSINTMKHSVVSSNDHSYKPSLLAACEIILGELNHKANCYYDPQANQQLFIFIIYIIQQCLYASAMLPQYQQDAIPTIRQVYHEMRDAYHELNQVFIDIGVSPLSATEDLETKKITINQVLKKIPPEERLQTILNTGTRQTIKQKLSRYEGDNSLILSAKQNFTQIKKQQQKIYFLAAECQLPSVSQQFKQKRIQNIQNLHSFKDVAEIKKTKVKTIEKNYISQMYIQQGQAQLDNKHQPIIIKSNKKGQQLKKLDLLVHINFYDSHNSEKQYQFICIEEQTLGSIIQKFKCLIDTLLLWQKIKNGNQGSIAQKNQLYDKHYQPPPQKATNKMHNTSHRSDQFTQQTKYMIIEDAIYYEGNKNNLQILLNSALNKDRINYRCLQLNKVKISDLRVIFGKPYLYRHLQGCDHFIIFKQARLFMGNDEFNHDIIQVEKYPITVFESKMKRRKCEGCAQFFSDFVSIGDPLKNGENLYLCVNCHKDVHFDQQGNYKDGQKFKFITYIHD